MGQTPKPLNPTFLIRWLYQQSPVNQFPVRGHGGLGDRRWRRASTLLFLYIPSGTRGRREVFYWYLSVCRIMHENVLFWEHWHESDNHTGTSTVKWTELFMRPRRQIVLKDDAFWFPTNTVKRQRKPWNKSILMSPILVHHTWDWKHSPWSVQLFQSM